jgi:hypothetical protein
MATIEQIQIGQRFSFEVYPSAVLGNNFRDVRMEGIISARMAMNFGFDIASWHNNVYPSLPAGVPNDPMQYNYIRIQMPSGEYQVIGVPWIRPESIAPSVGGTIQLTFTNRTQTDLDHILQALSANGIAPDHTVVNPS